MVKIHQKTVVPLRKKTQTWSYGVMVSTLDFESSDPSSNLGRTLGFGYLARKVWVFFWVKI